MSYLGHFLDEHKPLCKPKVVAVETDWEFLCHVFPEPGFRSYFCGHIISKLANELRQQGIDSYFARQQRGPEFATIAGLLSNIRLTRDAALADVRCRIGSGDSEGESSAREWPNLAIPPVREEKRVEQVENQEGTEETGPEYVGFVSTEKFPFSGEQVKKALEGLY